MQLSWMRSLSRGGARQAAARRARGDPRQGETWQFADNGRPGV